MHGVCDAASCCAEGAVLALPEPDEVVGWELEWDVEGDGGAGSVGRDARCGSVVTIAARRALTMPNASRAITALVTHTKKREGERRCHNMPNSCTNHKRMRHQPNASTYTCT